MKQASSSDNSAVLASVADTLNYHFATFSAIGAADDLFKNIFEAYGRIAGAGLLYQNLITSLLDVAIRLPEEASTVAILRRDIVQLDQKFAMAASSPVSDVPDSLNASNKPFSEEISQLLNSGTSMDESSLVRVFEALANNLNSCRSSGSSTSATELAQYLAQLRTFNHKSFDTLMINWLKSLFKSPGRSTLSAVIPPLVGVGCVSLPPLFALVNHFIAAASPQDSNNNQCLGLRIDTLKILDPHILQREESFDGVSNTRSFCR